MEEVRSWNGYDICKTTEIGGLEVSDENNMDVTSNNYERSTILVGW